MLGEWSKNFKKFIFRLEKYIFRCVLKMEEIYYPLALRCKKYIQIGEIYAKSG